jgi:hypothetical protein
MLYYPPELNFYFCISFFSVCLKQFVTVTWRSRYFLYQTDQFVTDFCTVVTEIRTAVYTINYTEINQSQSSNMFMYTAISIKVVPEPSGKVEYERERLLGIPATFRARIRLFRSAGEQPLLK